MKKLFISLCMAASFSANAEWNTVAVNSNTGKPLIAIDYERTFTSNGYTYVWYKDFTFGNLESVDYPGYHPINVYRMAVNCKNRTTSRDYNQSLKVRNFYNLSDAYITNTWTGKASFEPEEPGSAGEFVVKLICKF